MIRFSDATYGAFFALGAALYAAAPQAATAGSRLGFVAATAVILSMYGGGFATIPAYLADLFGSRFVGAIHGRLLTAWSTAGVVGPLVVTWIRQSQVDAGVQGADLYTRTLLVLAGFLVVGFVLNILVRPLGAGWFRHPGVGRAAGSFDRWSAEADRSFGIGRGGLSGGALLAWAAVGLPIVWGVWVTVEKTLVLLR